MVGAEPGGDASRDARAAARLETIHPGHGALLAQDVEGEEDGDDAHEAFDPCAVLLDALFADLPPNQRTEENADYGGEVDFEDGLPYFVAAVMVDGVHVAEDEERQHDGGGAVDGHDEEHEGHGEDARAAGES